MKPTKYKKGQKVYIITNNYANCHIGTVDRVGSDFKGIFVSAWVKPIRDPFIFYWIRGVFTDGKHRIVGKADYITNKMDGIKERWEAVKVECKKLKAEIKELERGKL